MDIIIFKIMNRLFCIDVQEVDEVINKGKLTRVPNTPKYIEGLFSLRGDLVTLFNTYELLNYSGYICYNNIIIVGVNNEKVGLMVDEVLDIIYVDRKDIEMKETNIKGIIGSIKIRGEIVNVMDVITLISKNEG